MKKTFLLFNILFFISTTLFSQQWYPVGANDSDSDVIEGTSFSHIAISSTGVVYQAFIDKNNGNKASVRKLDGDKWTHVGTPGFSPSTVGGDIKIMVDSQGAPYVYFRDGNQGNRGTVMKFTNNAWVVQYWAGFSDGSAADLNLAINLSNNTPYYSYRDARTNMFYVRVLIDPYFTYLVKNVDVKKDVPDAFYNTKLGVSQAGIVHLMYHNGGFKIKRFTNNDWVDMNLGTTFENTTYSSSNDMTLFGNDIYVIYNDHNESTFVKKFTHSSNTWSTVGAGTIAEYVVVNPKITVVKGIPYIAYLDKTKDYKVFVKKFVNNIWEDVGSAVSAKGVSALSIVGNQTTGAVYVGYTSGSNNFLKVFQDQPLVLPVKLQAFTAKLSNANSVELSWKTASETNNKYFSILKSRDGITYKNLGTYTSKGSNSTYTVTDKLPYLGVNYYKLQQTDLDGKTSELGVETVNVKTLANKGLTAYPNPVKDGTVHLNFEDLNGKNEVKIYDLTGKLISSEQLNFVSGKATLKLNFSVNKGLYLLNVANKMVKLQIN